MSGDCGHGWGYHFDGVRGPCFKCAGLPEPIFPKTVYDKVRNGAIISDEELEVGLKFFRNLSSELIKVGPVFHLAFAEANRVYIMLSDFKQARRDK